MNFYYKNTKKDIIMTQEDKEDFGNNNIFRFCERETISDKVRDCCHLTGRYRDPAQSKCNINVKQSQSFLLVLYYINIVIMIVIYFLKS